MSASETPSRRLFIFYDRLGPDFNRELPTQWTAAGEVRASASGDLVPEALGRWGERLVIGVSRVLRLMVLRLMGWVYRLPPITIITACPRLESPPKQEQLEQTVGECVHP